jgi:hypothetical protein
VVAQDVTTFVRPNMVVFHNDVVSGRVAVEVRGLTSQPLVIKGTTLEADMALYSLSRLLPGLSTAQYRFAGHEDRVKHPKVGKAFTSHVKLQLFSVGHNERM